MRLPYRAAGSTGLFLEGLDHPGDVECFPAGAD